MSFHKFISTFSRLGEAMTISTEAKKTVFQKAENTNTWFTEKEINRMVDHLVKNYFNSEKLANWIDKYEFPTNHQAKIIGLISAGNIPLVSIHDLMCIILAGNIAHIKLSEKDTALYHWVFSLIEQIDPDIFSRIHIVDQVKNYDAVIATGGNLAANQFKYYFQHKPNLIRGHRNSIAVLNGQEDNDTLKSIGLDIFSYYGMGCRNVSKIFVPLNYDFDHFLGILDKEFNYVRNHHKFQNNYDYQLALFLLNKVKFLQAESILLLEHEGIASPLACLYFERYESLDEVYQFNLKHKDAIQCVISQEKINDLVITPPGMSQHPELSDYADMNDTLNFLFMLN